jgi:hypothetical protein
MKSAWLTYSFLLLAACNETLASGPVPSSNGSAAPVTPQPSRFSKTDICASPGLLLVDTAIDQATVKYCDLCGIQDCDGKFENLTCDAADDVRNTIFASAGHPFKKKKWQERFGQHAWYRPDPAYDDKNLSAVAMRNISVLGAKSCTRTMASQGTAWLASAPTDGTVVEKTYDLDGDGVEETISLSSNGVVVSGIAIPDSSDFETLEILDLKRSTKRIEFAVVPQVVDDDAQYHVFAYEKGKIVSLGEAFGHHLEVPGNGTIIGTTGNCGQTYRTLWRLANDKLTKVKTTTTGKYNINLCSACPYVFVDGPNGYTFVDKIARNLVGEQAADYQFVQLPASSDKIVKVRVAERETEVSFFDEIYLTVDGRRVEASSRVLDARGPQLGSDVTLHYGGQVDYEFEIGPHDASADIKFWGHGYYQPVAPAL